jgi:hypothetical protein
VTDGVELDLYFLAEICPHALAIVIATEFKHLLSTRMRPQRRDLQAEPQTKAQNQREQRNTDPQEPTHEVSIFSCFFLVVETSP